LHLLKKTVKSELGVKGRLEYQILVENHKLTGLHKKNLSGNQFENRLRPEDIKNPFVIPGIKAIEIDPQLNSDYTFENFIEGGCNRLGRSAGLSIADKPGNNMFNPLFLYGDVGLGKTHLIHAIGNEISNNHPKNKVLYVSLERFTNQVIQSIKNNTINDFMNFYQMIDTLIIDDVQYLANRAKTQEIFFNIFNQLHQKNKQIIMTSDRPPKDLSGIEQRLISRFKWGLSADLTVPDFETRMAILLTKLEKTGVQIPQDVQEFICYNVKNNVRDLEGILISLVAQSSLNQRQIDVALAKEVLQKFISQINKEVTIEGIKEMVAEYFEVPVEKLQAKTRKRPIVIARQLSMYLAKNWTKKSLKAIGEKFGGRDHSTVIYACQQVRIMMSQDEPFRDHVAELEKQVKFSLNG